VSRVHWAMQFTVRYCANWDGGQQELGAASEAIRRVFPDADITAECVDDYPIEANTKLGIWKFP
jgi:hypothetical protein